MNPLEKIKSKSAAFLIDEEILLLMKFSKWLEYDLALNGNLQSKIEYQVMNDWLANYVKNNYSVNNIAEPFKSEDDFIKFGFYFARLWNKKSLRDMEIFQTYEIKVINNKYEMVKK